MAYADFLPIYWSIKPRAVVLVLLRVVHVM
jgi:hypothetical protein